MRALVLALLLPLSVRGQAAVSIPSSNCPSNIADTSTYGYIAAAPPPGNWAWSADLGWYNPIQSYDNNPYGTYGTELVSGAAGGCYVCEYSYSTQPSSYWASRAPGGSPGSQQLFQKLHAIAPPLCYTL